MGKRPLSFVIIGSGWRAMFYVRIARQNPHRFRLKQMLCRSEEKAGHLREEGIPATVSEKACEESEPDFVVVAVSKPSIFQVTREWALKGFPVLCETPAGLRMEELQALWQLKEQHNARIQVAEQYIRYPVMAAGLRILADGRIGDPYSVHLSVAHDYHGISLIRHLLKVRPEPVVMRGKRYVFPVTETDSRYGAVRDGSVKDRERTCITMEFSSGKRAYYDFSGVQYHSFIRSRHINVQGQKGEWNDTTVRYVAGENLPRQERLLPWLDPRYRDLETEEVKRLAGEWNPYLTLETAQDEYALASLMVDMEAYIEQGKEAYPLRDALEDVYLWLLMEQELAEPGAEVRWEPQPWHRGGEGS